MSKNIVLIGMMGSGKSTVGKILSRRLKMELVDTEKLIEAREGRPIAEIFAAEGEAYFRDREREVSEELGQRDRIIIACGGGLPLREDCIGPLKAGGSVFFLRRDPGETYDTVSMKDRPLAQDGRQAFLDRFAQREPVYRRWADHTVRAGSAGEAAHVVARIYTRDTGETKP